MPPRTKNTPRDITRLILGIAILAGTATQAAGYPGLLIVWAGLILVGWTALPPLLTGRKDAAGRPTPAHTAEQRAVVVYRRWQTMSWRLAVPTPDWLPGWPVHGTWLAGTATGLLATFLPLIPTLPNWAPFANGAADGDSWSLYLADSPGKLREVCFLGHECSDRDRRVDWRQSGPSPVRAPHVKRRIREPSRHRRAYRRGEKLA